MNTTKILKLSFVLFLCLSLFASCSKDAEMDVLGADQTENLVDPDSDPEVGSENPPPQDPEEELEDILDFEDCFEVVFPITVNLPDATQVIATDEDSLEVAIVAWYEANPEVEELPTLVYPIAVIVESGPEQTIQNLEELNLLAETCHDEEEEDDDDDEDGDDDDGDDDDDDDDEDGDDEGDCDFHEECFDVQFPLSIIMPDGVEYTFADETEAEVVIDAYYEANPDEEEDPQLVFPVTIIYEDGTTELIASEEAFEAAEELCE